MHSDRSPRLGESSQTSNEHHQHARADTSSSIDSLARGHFYPGIDGLRALAVLLVVLIHSGVPQASRGYIGVDIFFVISGFIITLAMVREHHRTGSISLRRFYLRRFWRLAPALGVMLLVAAVLEIGFGAATPLDYVIEAVKAGTFTYNIWWAAAGTGWTPAMTLAHTWSLGVEAQFYLLWGVALLVGLRRLHSRRNRLIASVVLGLSFTLARIVTVVALGTDSAAWWPWSRIDELIAGGVLAIALHHKPPIRVERVLRHPFAPAAGSVGLILYLKLGHGEFEPTTALVGLPMLVSLTALIVGHLYLSPGKGTVSRVLAWKPLRWLGRRSYGLYLFHYPITITLSAHHVAWQWELLVTIAGTVVLASLSFPLVEKPLRRFGARPGTAAWERPQNTQFA